MSIEEMATRAAELREKADHHRIEAMEASRLSDAADLEAEVLERTIGSRSVIGVRETLRMFRGRAA